MDKSASKASNTCFVCKESFEKKQPRYLGFCELCAAFNEAKREQKAELKGRVALITGARIGIGYATALKLLRDGAFVIATTRFPHHAAQQYANEADFLEWGSKLHLYGLDFTQIDQLEIFTQKICEHYPQLDILINNAAQTVRHPIEFYQAILAIEHQTVFPKEIETLFPSHYRFNSLKKYQKLLPLESKKALASSPSKTIKEPTTNILSTTPTVPEKTQTAQNSWMMIDEEVSLQELLEVHTINSMAPFLLCSRLKSLMKKTKIPKFIINVTSTEGRFSLPNKNPRHPHTNMVKASLNMMTHTCASEYAKNNIFMNCVDPGWISYQQPIEQIASLEASGQKPILDVVDAAARICDPIYIGINEGHYWSGKLFKDFMETNW